MKLKTMFFSMAMATTLLSASECSFTAQSASVGWEAYKTPKKAGVKGTFDAIDFEAASAESVVKLLEGAKVRIDTKRVNSGNEGRDKTLVESFFSLMTSEMIEGSVKSVTGDKNEMIVSLSMNGVTREVPMAYSLEGENLQAVGYIDMFDFALNKAHASINKACYDLHSGKTWSDVKVTAEISVEKKCK